MLERGIMMQVDIFGVLMMKTDISIVVQVIAAAMKDTLIQSPAHENGAKNTLP